jgi:hypothetical protein
MLLSNLPFPVKLLIAVLWDIVDAINILPLVGDIGEAFAGGTLAFLLTGNWKAVAAGAIDGILPPPIDFLPATTAVVIADELGWLD